MCCNVTVCPVNSDHSSSLHAVSTLHQPRFSGGQSVSVEEEQEEQGEQGEEEHTFSSPPSSCFLWSVWQLNWDTLVDSASLEDCWLHVD